VEKLAQEARKKMKQMRPTLKGIVIIALVLFCAPARPVAAFAPQQQDNKPAPYTIPEYNAFQAARAETNPANRIKLLDDFVSKFPASTLMPLGLSPSQSS
jgi:hypothetical protein